MIYRHVGPRRDHIELGVAEERALAELERSLHGPDCSRGRWAGRAIGRHGPRRLAPPLALVRLAPWLLPIGALLMVAAISTSLALSFVGALLAAAGLAATLERLASRLRQRRARRALRGS